MARHSIPRSRRARKKAKASRSDRRRCHPKARTALRRATEETGATEPTGAPTRGARRAVRRRATRARIVALPQSEQTTTFEIVRGGNGEPHALHFFYRGRLIPARLGKHLIGECPIRLGHDRRLWRYAHGVYRPDGDDWARQRTRELVGERFRRNHLEEVSAYLRAQLPTLGHAPPEEFINCTNGLLEWRTAVLHPHSPNVLTTNQITVAWKPEAVAPRFESFLREVLPDDAVDLVEELVGYALYAGNPFRKAVMLLGPGGNGKSVLLRLITALLAKENVATVPLQALGEDRFSAADLFGKLANICGDLDARAIERTDLFKQITGGDPIRAQHKFRDAFSFVSFALPLFSANEAPRTQDQTDAWFDRWIIVPMLRRFEGTPEEDTGLSDKLAAEVEGVLVRAVAGLRRLMARGRFVFPPSVERAREGYRQTLDTVRAFVTEQCHFDPDGWVDRATLYQRYKRWCREESRFALPSPTFNAHLGQAYEDRLALRTRHGRPGWRGIATGPQVVRRCPGCGAQIALGPGTCPNCGRPHGSWAPLQLAADA